MVNLKELIKKFFNKNNRVIPDLNKKSNFVENVVANARFGDIILSKNTDKGSYSLEKDVLVVIGKTDNELLGYYCETLPNNDMESLIDYKLFKNGRDISTPYKLMMVNGASFYKKGSRLDGEDNDQIIMNLKYHYKEHEQELGAPNIKLLFNHLIRIRDIVLLDGKYYLVLNSVSSVNKFTSDICNEKFLLLPVKEYNIVNLDCDLIDYEKACRVSVKENDIKYVSSISRERYALIVKKYYRYVYRKNELVKAKKSKGLKKGYVVSYNDKLYYIYGVNGDKASAFEISVSETDFKLIAGNTRFIPFYDKQICLSIKDNDYTFIDLAYSNEILDIANEQERYLKMKVIKEKKLHEDRQIDGFNVGDVIENANFLGLKFIVIGTYFDKIITINYIPFIENGEFIYTEFMMNDKLLYLSDDVSNQDKAIIGNNIGLFNSLCRRVGEKKKTLFKR